MNYVGKLRDEWPCFARRKINYGRVRLEEIPYCREELTEMTDLYLGSTVSLQWKTGYASNCTNEPLNTFPEIMRIEPDILPREEVHRQAKEIAARQWYKLYRHEAYVMCLLKQKAKKSEDK